MFDQEKHGKTRFVVVTGGVCSSIGKGVLISSLGTIFKNTGYSVSVVKWDPYLNVDSGTMSPLEHGEVFVTADGGETDLDLGHYERFLDISLERTASLTAGKVFHEILHKEREGDFLGHCIQLVPHAVDTIKRHLFRLAESLKVDVLFIEIGGTVGDMEGEIFLETIRQLKRELPEGYMTLCHLSYVPYLEWAHEIKTKPTQHSVMLMKKAGLVPDALFLRTERDIDKSICAKVALFCDVQEEAVFQLKTYSVIYKLFPDLYAQGVGSVLQKIMKLDSAKKADLSKWTELVQKIEQAKTEVRVGLIVKYHGNNDPYISVLEAIKAAAYATDVKVKIEYIEAELLEKQDQTAVELLHSVDGIIVPGGFGERGFEGKVLATTWARESKVPLLGLCLGMQVMLVEAARSLLGLKDAASTEMNKNSSAPIIDMLDEQRDITRKGSTMRLGSYECHLLPGSRAHAAYQVDVVQERHRHRYEFNNRFKPQLEAAGVLFSGVNIERNLVEIAEIKEHPFMVGVQFHPEFQSRPLRPHPLFKAFFEAIIKKK
jgi:CTP synthase